MLLSKLETLDVAI